MHPDADKLSAFLEQALPAHEREDVLAHLALCRNCRETVAMALPPAEEMEKSALAAASIAQEVSVIAAARTAAPERRRRWMSWTIGVPAAAAVAALALFLVFLHRAPKLFVLEQARNAQLPSAVQEQAKAPEAAQVSAGSPARESKELAQKKTAPAAGPDRSPIEGKSREPLAAARPPETTAPPPSAPTKGFDERMAAGGAMHGTLGVTTAGSQTASPTGGLQTATQSEESFVNGETLKEPAPKPAAAAVQPLPAPAPQPVEPANVPPPPVETESVPVTDASVASGATLGEILPRPLPSGQNVLSTARYGSRMLSIDTRHFVFLSTDSGAHWKRLSGQWQGQAVRVNLMPAAAASAQPATNMPAANLAIAAGLSRPAANELQGSLTGTVTDSTGAVIPGATITVTGAAAKNAGTAKTDAYGRYAVGELAPGNYNVEATAPGFEPLHLGGIAVGTSGPTVANLKLQTGAVSQSVTVDALTPELETRESAGRNRAKTSQAKLQPPAAFEITTDIGERWITTDGKHWTKE